nr:hypothetical protein [Mesorhizobium sp.]
MNRGICPSSGHGQGFETPEGCGLLREICAGPARRAHEIAHGWLVLLANGDRSLYCGLKQSMDVLV